MVAKSDYDKVLEEVSRWPLEDRSALISDLVRALNQPRATPPRDTLSKAIGLLKTDQPAPTDEDVRRWIDEHRMEKYGQR